MLLAGDKDEVELQFRLILVTSRQQSTQFHLILVTKRQQAASSVLYITSCKHSLALLRMGEIIARNMLS